ncbi:tRNA guanosine(34) transglycosylase Tgt [Candidatus Gottesmanbacteria bacterium]|nr:tRNA guanosine(34) transglycosylase Tgt [Candidatus Gottesmanbacteria bacterium]
MAPFRFELLHQDKKSRARLGRIHTPHGDIQTPAFVAVGTQGSVKSLTPDELKDLGVDVFMVNTYHMYLRPGMDVMKKVGGLHAFMGWNKPIMTDSGGFQVFSLARKKYLASDTGNQSIKIDHPLVKITEDGVEFRSHWDGSKHLFTPKFSMELQWLMGADIHIAFDDCTPYPVTFPQAKKSMERTHRWAKESLKAHRHLRGVKVFTSEVSGNHYQALYGSIQGSIFEKLRKQSAKVISGMDFDGIAIGGVSVGEGKKEMVQVLDWVTPLLPKDTPRHVLGVGEIDDIFELVSRGIDTFDCVQPTRLARMGRLLVGNKQIYKSDKSTNRKFEIDITKKEYSKDTKPIDAACMCYTCKHFSRAYVHHLFRVRELLVYRLATIHNIHFINTLMEDIRSSIADGTFLELTRQYLYHKPRG